MPLWERGGDQKVSAIHIWVIGMNGGGKSTTLRTLVAPGLAGGWLLPILCDGKGDSLDDLAPWALGRSVARDRTTWEQAITTAYMIMVARQARLGTDQAWTGPTPTDPLVMLMIDECSTVLAALDKPFRFMVEQIGRLGRSLGVSTLQSGQTPNVETLIGGAPWRGQCRLVIGHRVNDRVHSAIAAQSGGPGGPSLLGLPTGRVAVLDGGSVLSRRAKVAYLTADDLTEIAAEPAQLAEADLDQRVAQMLDLADGWGQSCPEPVIDITDDVLESWGAPPAHTLPRPAPAAPLPAVVPAQATPAGDDSAPAPQPSLAEQSPAAGPVPAQQSAQVISIKGRRPRAQGLEETVLAWLLASRPERFPRRIDLVEAMEAAGVGSRSGLQAAIRRMVEASPAQLIQEHGRLAPVLRWHEGCMDELHAVDAAEASQ